MKKSDVKTGEVYSCKVSGHVVPVRIDRENPRGGWDGTNMKTRKAVRVKSAQRLRGKAVWPPKTMSKADAVNEAMLAVADAKKAEKAGKAQTKAKKADTGKRRGTRAKRGERKAKRPSGLDAAAKVLGEAGRPLGCKEIVDRMLAKGLWQTKGKTPAATIYAAIIREIAKRGKDSRFRKVDRGKFELAK